MNRRNILKMAAAAPLALALPAVATAAPIPRNKGLVHKFDGYTFKQWPAMFHRGQRLGADDLCLFLVDSSGRPVHPAEIAYSISAVLSEKILQGPARRIPIMKEKGHFFAGIVIPHDVKTGTYCVDWTIRQYADSKEFRVTQTFSVVDELHIWTDDTETVIAASPEDADALIREMTGARPSNVLWSESLSDADTKALREQVDLALADPDLSVVTNHKVHWEEIRIEPASERWHKLDDEKPLTIWWEGDELIGFNLGSNLWEKKSERPGWVPATAHAVTKTRAEWCLELGRSYLGSTEV